MQCRSLPSHAPCADVRAAATYILLLDPGLQVPGAVSQLLPGWWGWGGGVAAEGVEPADRSGRQGVKAGDSRSCMLCCVSYFQVGLEGWVGGLAVRLRLQWLF